MRRRFSRKFTFEAGKLVTERGLAVAQAARDLVVGARSVSTRRIVESLETVTVLETRGDLDGPLDAEAVCG